MKLKTYIINLEKSTVRRQYMQELLSGYEFLDVEFLKAIDGRLFSGEERRSMFDYEKSVKLYGKDINPGEVGCALSHRKAYEELLRSGNEYALILEDDISIVRDLQSLDISEIDSIMKTDVPKAMMLSGDYWYLKRQKIVRLFSAVGAYAYLVNRAAAKRILSILPPCCVADDWMFYKRNGIKLYAIHPYLIDANLNMDSLGSDVKQDTWAIDRSKISPKEMIIGYFNGAVKKLLKLFGHFEYKNRVINNIVVEQHKNPFK